MKNKQFVSLGFEQLKPFDMEVTILNVLEVFECSYNVVFRPDDVTTIQKECRSMLDILELDEQRIILDCLVKRVK